MNAKPLGPSPRPFVRLAHVLIALAIGGCATRQEAVSLPATAVENVVYYPFLLAPDGTALGTVDDVRSIAPGETQAVFSGRVGNSAGGAFVPGQYTVNFYLNGQYFAQKKFRVLADAGSTYGSAPGGYVPSSGTYSSGSGLSSGLGAGGTDLPTLATGTISGIGGHSSAGLELRLRPQPNGFLHGEMVVELVGYGTTPIEGFVRGDHVQFQVPYGADTYAFEGRQNGDTLSGTFEAEPSGQRGTWTAHGD